MVEPYEIPNIADNLGFLITIDDILKLQPGKPYLFLAFDRNFGDCCYCKYNSLIGKDVQFPLPSKDFFDYNFYHIIYIKDTMDDIKGRYKVFCYYDLNDLDVLNHFKHGTYLDKLDETYLEINYQTHCWYPLDKKGNFKTKHWKDYSLNTKLGWRGPMMFWSNIDFLPNIVRDDTVWYPQTFYENIYNFKEILEENDLQDYIYGSFFRKHSQRICDKVNLEIIKKSLQEDMFESISKYL